MTALDNLFCNIYDEPGLYGIYSLPDLGYRELIMYVSQMLIKEGKAMPLIFSLELPEKLWFKAMNDYGLSVEGIRIVDTPCCSVDEMRNRIKEKSPGIVFIDRLRLIDDHDIISKLKSLSEDCSISVVAVGYLPRNSGDHDPVYRRPHWLDLIYTYSRDKTIGEFLEDMHSFTSIMLLHQCHEWHRGIGSGHAYHICYEAELMVRGEGFSPDYSVCFDFARIIKGKIFG